METLRVSKSVVVETCESLILLSAGSLDGFDDTSVHTLESEIGGIEFAGAFDESETRSEETSSFLSRLRDAMSFAESNRRRSAFGFDAVEGEVQLVEPRLLLSTDSIAGFGDIVAPESHVDTTAGAENLAPFFRYIEIRQDRGGLDGTGQIDGHDPDGDSVSYAIVGGRHADRFEIGAETGVISFQHVPAFSGATGDTDPRYHVIIRVSDGRLHRDQEILFTENPNIVPSFISKRIILPENLAFVGQQHDGVTGDRGFSLSGPDADLFQLDGVANIRFVEPPDFEAPQGSDVDNEYKVTRVTDLLGPRGNIYENITIQVVDVDHEGNNAPLLLSFDRNVKASENRRFVLEQWEAYDADGDPVEYSIVGGTDADLFELNSFESVLRFKEAPDFEIPADADANNNYRLVLRVSDGSLFHDYDVDVTVEDERIFRRDSVHVKENFSGVIPTPAGQQTTEIIGIDAEHFEVDSDGNVRFKVRPEFESPDDLNGDNQYQFSQKLLREDGENFVRGVTVHVTDVIGGRSSTELAAEPFYTDAVTFNSAPVSTLSTRPRFQWDQQEDVTEYEIFVGRRGKTDAVFRTRELSTNEFELPDDLEPGEYTAWLRAYNAGGTFSRWGSGHDFSVGGRPRVSFDHNKVTWEAVPGADRYEVWADEIDAYGNRLARQVISHADVADTSFTVTGELADKNLAWWVRAIGDQDSAVEQSDWSVAAYAQQPELLPEPQNPKVVSFDPCGYQRPQIDIATPPESQRLVRCLALGFSRITWDPVSEAIEYEIVVTRAGETEPLLRERGISEVPHQLSWNLQQHTHDVWVRALGTGVAKSRWVKISEYESSL